MSCRILHQGHTCKRVDLLEVLRIHIHYVHLFNIRLTFITSPTISCIAWSLIPLCCVVFTYNILKRVTCFQGYSFPGTCTLCCTSIIVPYRFYFIADIYFAVFNVKQKLSIRNFTNVTLLSCFPVKELLCQLHRKKQGNNRLDYCSIA